MINAYREGKDLYSVIASMSFDRKYEDCLEFYPEGTVIDYEGQKVVCGYKTHQNKEGKHYRSMSKSILLGRSKDFIDLDVKQNAPLRSNSYWKRKWTSIARGCLDAIYLS